MNPQVTPGNQLQPASIQQSPQGVTSVTPISQPTAPQLPNAKPLQAPPAPLQNPSFNPSAGLDTIAQYYKIPQEQALNVAQTQAQGNVGQQQFNQQKFQAGVQEQNLRDKLDPSKYKVEQDPKSQYGIKITDSTGNPVDLGTYVNLTGDSPAKVLQSSSDPHAQQFVQAYNNFEDLMQTTLAASGGDQQAKIKLGEYYKANPGLQGMKPDDVSKLFMNRYGQFFGMPQQQAVNVPGVNQAFTSQNGPIASSPYYQMQAYPGLSNPNPITSQLLGNSGGADLSSMLSQLQSQQGQ